MMWHAVRVTTVLCLSLFLLWSSNSAVWSDIEVITPEEAKLSDESKTDESKPAAAKPESSSEPAPAGDSSQPAASEPTEPPVKPTAVSSDASTPPSGSSSPPSESSKPDSKPSPGPSTPTAAATDTSAAPSEEPESPSKPTSAPSDPQPASDSAPSDAEQPARSDQGQPPSGETRETAPSATDAARSIGSVAALEGDCKSRPKTLRKEILLKQGDPVSLGDDILTAGKSKLWIKFDNNIDASMAQFSEITVEQFDTEALPPLFDARVIEGMVRFIIEPPNTEPPPVFTIRTPTALVSIDPPGPNEDVPDFVVHVVDTSFSSVTVIRGKVRVRNISEGFVVERTVRACQTVNVEYDKEPTRPYGVSSKFLESLIKQTTIPGTLREDVPTCEREPDIIPWVCPCPPGMAVDPVSGLCLPCGPCAIWIPPGFPGECTCQCCPFGQVVHPYWGVCMNQCPHQFPVQTPPIPFPGTLPAGGCPCCECCPGAPGGLDCYDYPPWGAQPLGCPLPECGQCPGPNAPPFVEPIAPGAWFPCPLCCNCRTLGPAVCGVNLTGTPFPPNPACGLSNNCVTQAQCIGPLNGRWVNRTPEAGPGNECFACLDPNRYLAAMQMPPPKKCPECQTPVKAGTKQGSQKCEPVPNGTRCGDPKKCLECRDGKCVEMPPCPDGKPRDEACKCPPEEKCEDDKDCPEDKPCCNEKGKCVTRTLKGPKTDEDCPQGQCLKREVVSSTKCSETAECKPMCGPDEICFEGRCVTRIGPEACPQCYRLRHVLIGPKEHNKGREMLKAMAKSMEKQIKKLKDDKADPSEVKKAISYLKQIKTIQNQLESTISKAKKDTSLSGWILVFYCEFECKGEKDCCDEHGNCVKRTHTGPKSDADCPEKDCLYRDVKHVKRCVTAAECKNRCATGEVCLEGRCVLRVGPTACPKCYTLKSIVLGPKEYDRGRKQLKGMAGSQERLLKLLEKKKADQIELDVQRERLNHLTIARKKLEKAVERIKKQPSLSGYILVFYCEYKCKGAKNCCDENGNCVKLKHLGPDSCDTRKCLETIKKRVGKCRIARRCKYRCTGEANCCERGKCVKRKHIGKKKEDCNSSECFKYVEKKVGNCTTVGKCEYRCKGEKNCCEDGKCMKPQVIKPPPCKKKDCMVPYVRKKTRCVTVMGCKYRCEGEKNCCEKGVCMKPVTIDKRPCDKKNCMVPVVKKSTRCVKVINCKYRCKGSKNCCEDGVCMKPITLNPSCNSRRCMDSVKKRWTRCVKIRKCEYRCKGRENCCERGQCMAKREYEPPSPCNSARCMERHLASQTRCTKTYRCRYRCGGRTNCCESGRCMARQTVGGNCSSHRCEERYLVSQSTCTTRYGCRNRCGSGEECVGGRCRPIDPCRGVQCPRCHKCKDGHCVDMCQDKWCDHGQHCVCGQCVTKPPEQGGCGAPCRSSRNCSPPCSVCRNGVCSYPDDDHGDDPGHTEGDSCDKCRALGQACSCTVSIVGHRRVKRCWCHPHGGGRGGRPPGGVHH